MHQKSLIIFLAVASIIITAPAWAECVQGDLKGKWSSVLVCRGSLLGEPCWDNLDLLIDSDGVIKKGKVSSDCQGQKGKVIGGQLTIFSGCQIKGVIQTDSGVILVERGGIVDGKLVLSEKLKEIELTGSTIGGLDEGL